MKKLLVIIVLSLCFILPSQADDVRDFQIDGISIGDSLLDHYSETEIKTQLSKTVSNYKSERIKRVYFVAKKNSIYEQLNFHFINDSSYRIVMAQGHNLYENNMPACYKKQIEVTKELENIFSVLKKSEGTYKHRADKTGKSKLKTVALRIKNGDIRIVCTSWSKQIKKKTPWKDSLKIIISNDEYKNWINNEAY